MGYFFLVFHGGGALCGPPNISAILNALMMKLGSLIEELSMNKMVVLLFYIRQYFFADVSISPMTSAKIDKIRTSTKMAVKIEPLIRNSCLTHQMKAEGPKLHSMY